VVLTRLGFSGPVRACEKCADDATSGTLLPVDNSDEDPAETRAAPESFQSHVTGTTLPENDRVREKS